MKAIEGILGCISRPWVDEDNKQLLTNSADTWNSGKLRNTKEEEEDGVVSRFPTFPLASFEKE